MTTRPPSSVPPVTEDDLHAFLDGALAPERARQVEAWLAENPEAAREVETWRAQDSALRTLFADQAYGDATDLPMHIPPRTPIRAWAMAAALLFTFGVGGGAGYVLRELTPDPPASRPVPAGWLAETADEVYLTYAGEVRHPVEVGASEEEHLVTWLGNRIEREFSAPDLAALGYTLVGGRLLPLGGVPGAMLMYENAAGSRVTVLLARSLGAQDTAFQFSHARGVSTFTWVEGPLAYAISGRLDRADLQPVTRAIYDHFETG